MYISSLPAYCLLKNLIQDITNSILHMSKNMQIAIQKFPLEYQAMLWRWLWGGFVYEHFSWVFSKEAEENSSKTTALTASVRAQALTDVSVIKENSIILYIKWTVQSCSFCSLLTFNLYMCCNRKLCLSWVFS